MANLHPVELFSAILKSLGLVIDGSGGISMPLNDSNIPIVINERRLVLPTQEVLATYNASAQVAFQPLGESVLRGESEVIRRLRELVWMRVNRVLAEVLDVVALNASTVDATLRPDQVKLTSMLPNADESLVKSLDKILKKIKPGTDFELVRIYLKRNGRVGTTDYKRLASVSFPIMDQLNSHDDMVWGVKVRKRDKAQLRDLMLHLLPNCETEHGYSYGSNSPTAPYFDALIHAFYNVLKPLNTTTYLFRKQLDIGEIHSNMDWIDACKDLSIYRSILPVLSGNDGDLVNGAGETIAAAPTAAYVPPTVAATPTHVDSSVGAPLVQPNLPHQSDDGSGFLAAVRAKNAPQYAHAVPSFPKVGQAYTPPAPAYTPPMPQYGYGAPTAPSAVTQAYPSYQVMNQPVTNFPRVGQPQQPVAQQPFGYQPPIPVAFSGVSY